MSSSLRAFVRFLNRSESKADLSQHLPWKVCTIPTGGWRCTRQAGHDGPCAAVPTKVDYAEPPSSIKTGTGWPMPDKPTEELVSLELHGCTVKDIVTGFNGVVIGIVFYMTGCHQALVAPPIDKEGKRRDCEWFDLQRLVVNTSVPRITLDNEKTPGFGPEPPKEPVR